MSITAETIDRLKAQLLTSNLSQRNHTLYQVINQLIDALRQGLNELEAQVAAATPVVPPGPAIVTTNITGLPPMPGDDYGEGDDGVGEAVSARAGVFPYFKKGSVIFSDGVQLTEDNARFFWNDLLNFFGVGKQPAVPIDVLGTGVDIGYIGNFKEDGTIGSTFIKIETPSGANAQAGFTLFQSTHALEWRFRVVGNSSPQDSVEITNTLNGQGMWLNTRGQISANVNGHAFETIIQQRMPIPIECDHDEEIPILGGGSGSGAVGPAGPTGAPGAPGISFPFVVDADEPEVPFPYPGSVGATGSAGPAGATGPQGIPGFDGIDGDDGIDGAPGIPGVAGATGATGPAGPTGLIGPPGIDGEDPDEPMLIPGPQGPAGSSSSGGLTLTAHTQNLGAGDRSGTFDITGLAGLTVDKPVLIQQTAAPITTKGNARDEPEMDIISLTGYVLSTTSIRVYWNCRNVVVGSYNFAYAVSA